MIKPNWLIFKAKFSENTQHNFEWLCYLLFSNEFNLPNGIFRYVNQAAIETIPLINGLEVIGWQAKFYESSLSNHKAEILSTLEDMKKYYPTITRLIFYTNEEWGQNKGKKPNGLIEIEAKEKLLNVTIDWRTASFFESEFVSINNKVISKHFFTFDKSISDLIDDQQKHTVAILNSVQKNICYEDRIIELDRSVQLKEITAPSNQISILSGVGGVGKTAIIKKLAEVSSGKFPFYVFKANEFEIKNLNELITNHSFEEFTEIHQSEINKTLVIDSSEKLLDIKNIDPFREFLSIAVKGQWKIIFTTRDSYLEDLNYLLYEDYKLAPKNISIPNLTLKELNTLSSENHFALPKDEKLIDLIKNPFYLGEFLSFYQDKEQLNYRDFRNKLWNQNIKKSKPERERTFLTVAMERANKGQFFVTPNCDAQILDNFVVDGILGYELPGYFITHDIYEEWAIERFIEGKYITREKSADFFLEIGHTLPVRRSFRSWLSEKLFLEDSSIKQFILDTLENGQIDEFWKDEIYVSLLLSDDSKIFFNTFKNELIANEQKLLKKLAFILRIACKEVDDDFFKLLGIKNESNLNLKYFFTRPKGQGWHQLINFTYENIEIIQVKNINFILPVIYDWNLKFNKGETTKISSKLALVYLQWATKEEVYFSRDDLEDHLFETILNGSSEISLELTEIFDEIIVNKWKVHGNPYYKLSKFILTQLAGFTVAKVLPSKIIELADLFWTYTPKKDNYYSHSSLNIEHYFGIESGQLEYHPPSPFQSPIYTLLNSSLLQTVEFILAFTNKAVSYYANSNKRNNGVETVVIFVKDKKVSQFISNQLWCMYRGTQTSPHLLESMHMALEKYFLDIGKHADSIILENWLIYLIENSQSSSITAVVASIVLAYPEKTFNVAKILFKTQLFFLYDHNRQSLDRTHKTQLSMLKNFSLGFKSEIHEGDRIAACDAKHRTWSLESLCLNYQYFRDKDTSEADSEIRVKEIWSILDTYYKKLPPESEQTVEDKLWRLCLARMDKRKMKVTTEKTDSGVAISFNPEISPELKQYSEEALSESIEASKYTGLSLWASYKIDRDDRHKNYAIYEESPKQALLEVKEILSKLESVNEQEAFYLFNHRTPIQVCCILLKYYLNNLLQEEQEFCKSLIIETVRKALQANYRYQVSDGVQEAYSILPIIFNNFPNEKNKIKGILLLSLFNEFTVGGMLSYENFTIFPTYAINQLWENYFQEAQSILLGYLLIKPKYDVFLEESRKRDYKKGNFDFDYTKVREQFFTKNENLITRVIEDQVSYDDIKNIENLDLQTLGNAFKLIPQKTSNTVHKIIVANVISVFAKKLTEDSRDEKIDYKIKQDFLDKYSQFVLNSSPSEISDLLNPFIDNFRASKSIAELFQSFVLNEDKLNTQSNFWLVWEIFKPKVYGLCGRGGGYWYVNEIIESYLFARCHWKENVTEWHSLNDVNASFFNEISKEIPNCASTLFAISKLLNDIGKAKYAENGIDWLSNILTSPKRFQEEKLPTNTIFYIETYIRKYIVSNKEKIKRTKTLNTKVLIILDYLVLEASVIGYILRESII